MDVTGEMQVDVLHGHDLCIAAAGRAALNAKTRDPERVTQAEHRLLPRAFMASARPTLVVVLPLTGGRGADGGDENQLAPSGLSLLASLWLSLAL